MRSQDSDGSIHFICQKLSCQYEEREYKVKISSPIASSKKTFSTTESGKIKVVISKKSAVKVPTVYETKTEVVRESKLQYKKDNRERNNFSSFSFSKDKKDSGNATMADFFKLSKEREEERKNRKKK